MEYQCRVIGMHSKEQWFDIGEHDTTFSAKLQVIMQVEMGGLDLTFSDIECREKETDQ